MERIEEEEKMDVEDGEEMRWCKEEGKKGRKYGVEEMSGGRCVEAKVWRSEVEGDICRCSMPGEK